MKNYTITVNGNVYEVSVEESGAEGAPVAAAPKAAAPKAAPKKAAPAGAQGSVTIAAPMIGKILKVVSKNEGGNVVVAYDNRRFALSPDLADFIKLSEA